MPPAPLKLRSNHSTPVLSRQSLSPTADQFPRPAGSTLGVSKRDKGMISPASSTFTFEDPYLDSASTAVHALSPGCDHIDERRLLRPTSRGGGDPLRVRSTVEDPGLAKKKSEYFSEVFSYREPSLSSRERAIRESVVTADLKTNVIIKDEYTFLTTLSAHLSQRYARPQSSILITLTHSACLLLGSSFDPCYILTISALPSLVQPTTNKRNAALIQRFLETDSGGEGLGVPMHRGVLRFESVGEEMLARGGRTVKGEIEEGVGERGRSRAGVDEESIAEGYVEHGVQQVTERRRHSRSKRRQSMKNQPAELPFREENSRPPTRDNGKQTAKHDVFDAGPETPLQSPPLPPMPQGMSEMDRRADKVRKLGKRKSFIASMFSR